MRRVGLQLARAIMVVWIAGVVASRWGGPQSSGRPIEDALQAAEGIDDLTLADARRVLPRAHALGGVHAGWGGLEVVDAAGVPIGTVLRTSPVCDAIHGYAGPTDVLLGIDGAGRVVGAALRSSADTPEYVEAVRANENFWQALVEAFAGDTSDRSVDAISGSTLTCTAIQESIERRLRGRRRHHRFPNALTLAEVRAVAPDLLSSAARLDADGRIFDRNGVQLARAIRTAPFGDNIRGYAGPSDSLVLLSSDEQQLLAVWLRSSFDSPDYVERVREDDGFVRELTARSRAQWAELDAAGEAGARRSGVEGVSGATQTSYAMAEGVRVRLAALAQQETPRTGPLARGLMLLALCLGGLWLTYGAKRARWRRPWQILVVVLFGCWLGDLLSLAALAAGLRDAARWWTGDGVLLGGALGLFALAMVLAPWSSGQQPYCANLCPHGMTQEWIGSVRRWRRPLGRAAHRALSLVPGALLVAVVIGLVLMDRFASSGWSLASVEPFAAWSLWWAAPISLGLAVAGWLACLRTPMAYCRYGCPTGALLGYVRAGRGRDRWLWADSVALVLAIGTGLWGAWAPAAAGAGPAASESAEPALVGRVCGARWTLTVPELDATLRAELVAEARRLERVVWDGDPRSERSEFDGWGTTRPVEVSAELFALVAAAPQPDLALDPERRTLQKRRPESRIALADDALRDHVVDRLLAVVRRWGLDSARVAVGSTVRVMRPPAERR